jgi:hypothetical protein
MDKLVLVILLLLVVFTSVFTSTLTNGHLDLALLIGRQVCHVTMVWEEQECTDLDRTEAFSTRATYKCDMSHLGCRSWTTATCLVGALFRSGRCMEMTKSSTLFRLSRCTESQR